MKRVFWAPKARRQLKKIKDQRAISAIVDTVGRLESFPNVDGVKALTNHRYTHRIRVGDYRVLFNAFAEVEVVSVKEVKKRNERTYK